MRLSLCNEVIGDLDFAAQCALAAKLGYDGLELAPFTLSDHPERLPGQRRAELKRIAEDAGLAITGLHWLLMVPEGLSITSDDAAVRERTVDVMRRLIELCADLGGSIEREIGSHARSRARRRQRIVFECCACATEIQGVRDNEGRPNRQPSWRPNTTQVSPSGCESRAH
jgi:sugar phosphate isomerase/epimerase